MKKQLLTLIFLITFCFGSAFSQTNLQVSNKNPTNVTISWDNGGCTAGNYLIRSRENGTTPWSPTITIPNTGGSQDTILWGLTISTTYNWKIKCGGGGSWVNGSDFTTCDLSSTITITDASCDNTLDGGADLTVSGGTTPYTYSWDNGATTEDLNAVASGTYIVTITDNPGCTLNDTAIISFVGNKVINQSLTDFGPNPLTAYHQWAYDTLKIINTGCEVNIRPEFIISHQDSAIQQGDLVISWFNPLIGNWPNIPYNIDNNGNAYGFWSFTAGDSTGTSLTVGSTQQMIIRVKFVNPANYGNYNFSWETFEVDNLGNKIQVLTTPDSVLLALVDCSVFSIDNMFSSNLSCNGANDGSASVVGILNGSGNYSYLWSNGSTKDSISNLSVGTYSVVVTDNNWGCMDSATITITEPDSLTALLTGTNISCIGVDDGTLNASGSGGGGLFDIIWVSHPGLPPVPNQTNLAPGTYTIDVLDLNCGGLATTSYTLTEPSVLTALSSSIDNTSCDTSNCYGNITISLSGGTQPYSYSWSNGYTDSVRNDLCAETYIIDATDVNSCIIFKDTIVIYDSATIPNISLTGNPISCIGDSDGVAEVMIGSFSYCTSTVGALDYSNIELVRLIGDGDSISNNTFGSCDTYEDYTNLMVTLTPGQSYSVDINLGSCDSAGTFLTDGAKVFMDWNMDGDFDDVNEEVGIITKSQSPSSTTINFVVPTLGIFGTTRMRVVAQWDVDTTIGSCDIGGGPPTWNTPYFGATEDYSIIIISGSDPASYLWNTGDTTSQISNLSAGTYFVTVTDIDNCQITDSITITEPDSISVTISTTPVSCTPGNDGTATIYASGGTLPYSYSWSNGQTTQTAQNLAVGTYSVTVLDANLCPPATDSVVIVAAAMLNVNISVDSISCHNGSNGSLTANIISGTPPFSYSWFDLSNPSVVISSNATTSNLSSGAYSVLVIDNNGCEAQVNVTITQPDQISATFFSNNPTTISSCDGFVVANVVTYYPIVSYSWTNSQGNFMGSSNFISNLCNDAYILTVTDSMGCSLTDTIILGTIMGCTDSTALNYNWVANSDDGSCIAIVSGCTDSLAINYDSLANVDDGSCCLLSQISQIGNDIDGEAADDYSGYSVSLSSDGGTVAIGAEGNDGNGSSAGHVRIYAYNGSSWNQLGNDIDGEAAGDWSGRSVSLSSDGGTVAIGANGNDGNGQYAGHVRIYNYNGSSWNQLGNDIDGEAAGDASGESVSLSSDGNTVAIGAPGNDGNGLYSGHVRVYNWNGASWIQLGSDINGEASGDRSGSKVSLSSDGGTVAIGAPYNDGNGSSSGHVRIYAYNGTSWIQLGSDIDGEATGDGITSVSISSDGNTVAIGAENDGNGTNSGHVRIYNYDGTFWNKIGQDIDGEAAGDFSGMSVSLSSDGNTVAIGATSNDNGNGTVSGHVRIYQNIGGSWSQIGNDIDGEATDDFSGRSVSLSSDGSIVSIGANGNDGNGSSSGHVRIYQIQIGSSSCAGCTDPLALNYDSTVAYSDSSCIYPSGCMDSTALNYDSNAITDDGSCQYCDLSFAIYVSQNSSASACDGFAVVTSVQTSNLPATYSWSTGSTQNVIFNLCSGTYMLTITDAVGCSVDTTFIIGPVIYGCTDSTATNYDPNANIDDGSCTYACNTPISGLFMSDVIHDRATFNFDNMNTANCIVDQLRIKYSGDGGATWSQKNMGAPTGYNNGVCNSTQRTDKIATGLNSSTTYQWQMKVWYCLTGATAWVNGPNFTTADVCPNVINFAVSSASSTQATFTWDTTAAYSFVRIKLRVDTTNASWFSAGGFGVFYPALTKSKNGLSPGATYRGQARTWCNPTGGAYRSATWTPLIFWTQPTSARLEGENTAINNLAIYPNPSRNVFNISFVSEQKQNLRVSVLNVIGEVMITENLQQFVGEYTKQINLEEYPKAIYFLEIETDDGVINKKLILQ